MTVMGELLVQVAYKQQCERLPIVVVAGDGPSLLGRNWSKYIRLDKEIENLSKSCLACQSVRHAPATAPLHPWVWPSRPWQRIHVDFAGPFLGKSFLVVVDAHSKWPEVFEMSSTTASKTIATLRHLFAAYGLPEQLVSVCFRRVSNLYVTEWC